MERNVKRIRMKNPVGAFAGRSWSVPSVGRSPPCILELILLLRLQYKRLLVPV